MLDRIRESLLGPDQFARTFEALLQGINLTGNIGLAIAIDYGDSPVGPDELIPVITLSFRGNDVPNQQAAEEILQAIDSDPSLQEAVREGNALAAQDNAQDGPDVGEDPGTA